MEQLAKDLRAEFPDMHGFSKRNIFTAGDFTFYSGSSVQQAVALNQNRHWKFSGAATCCTE